MPAPDGLKSKQWQHAALTIDNENMSTAFYLNGEKIFSAELPQQVDIGASSTVLLGNRDSSLHGYRDELRLFSETIPHDRILSDYERGLRGLHAVHGVAEAEPAADWEVYADEALTERVWHCMESADCLDNIAVTAYTGTFTGMLTGRTELDLGRDYYARVRYHLADGSVTEWSNARAMHTVGELADADNDGLPDVWEMRYFGDAQGASPEKDPDDDGVSNLTEYRAGLNPHASDSDGDGIGDAAETEGAFSPVLDPDANLLGWWPLDNQSPIDAGPVDALLSASGTTVVPAVAAQGHRLDSSDDTLTSAGKENYHVHSAFTLSFFVQVTELYPDDSNGTAVTLAALPAADNTQDRITLRKTATHSLKLTLRDATEPAQTAVINTAPGQIVPGSWYHVAFTFNRPEAQLYVNGIPTGETELDTAFRFADEAAWSFGHGLVSGDGMLYGILDDVRLYGSELTREDVIALQLDWDNDELSNLREAQVGTDPQKADTDGDGIPDRWEVQHGTDPTDAQDAVADPDGDNLTNAREYAHGTDPQQADTDGDGIPDSWEVHHGLDPTYPQDAQADPDGDNLTSAEEYIHGTDPQDADTDRDGMPDGWELASELDPTDPQDAVADPDNDGFNNLEEYKESTDPYISRDSDGDGLPDDLERELGTDPHRTDTDNDGVSDYHEVYVAYTDPTTADFDGTVTDLIRLDGSDASDTLGNWDTDVSAITARDRKGWVAYDFTLEQAGMYRLVVDGTQNNPLTSQHRFNLRVRVDGVYVGRNVLDASHGSVGSARFYLPHLQAGEHTVRVKWSNNEMDTFLKIVGVRVQRLGGPDSDNDGTVDWQQNRMANLAALDEDTPAKSAVSPVCLEGRTGFSESMRVRSSYIPPASERERAVQDGRLVDIVHRAPEKRFYSNIPLNPEGTETQVNVSWQNGRREETHSVTWSVTNVIAEQQQDNGDKDNTQVKKLRVGDALLLNAFPEDAQNGTVVIKVDDKRYETTPGEPVVHRFTETGDYTVSADYTPDAGDTVTAEMDVAVRACSFNGTPACLPGKERPWDNPAIPEAAVLENDTHLNVTSEQLPGTGRTLNLLISRDETAHIIARLGEDGPVMANARVEPMTLNAQGVRFLKHLKTFRDGSTMYENRLTLGHVPDNLRIKLNIFVSGVTFEDGTISKTITADDINELGEIRYRMLLGKDVQASGCHNMRIWQGDTRVY